MKYIIDCGSARVLKARLGMVCKMDSNTGPDGSYRVSSLYFDDFYRSAVNDNLSGQLSRKKFRIRIYNGSDAFIRLERKVKIDGGCMKDSTVLTREQYNRITSGDWGFMNSMDSPVAKDFANNVRTRLLRPVVIVDYHREAFIHKTGNVRITLDRHIRASIGGTGLFDAGTVYSRVMEECAVILEVKFTGFIPRHIRDMIQLGHGTRESASKYVMCSMAAAQ